MFRTLTKVSFPIGKGISSSCDNTSVDPLGIDPSALPIVVVVVVSIGSADLLRLDGIRREPNAVPIPTRGIVEEGLIETVCWDWANSAQRSAIVTIVLSLVVSLDSGWVTADVANGSDPAPRLKTSGLGLTCSPGGRDDGGGGYILSISALPGR